MQKQAAALSYDFMSKDSSRGSNNKPKTSNSPFETGSPVVTLSSQSEKASKQSETNPRANSAKTPEEQQQHQDQHEDLPQINAQNIQNKLYEALSSRRERRLLRMSPNSVNGGFQQKTLQWVKKWGGLGKVECPSCLLSQHTAGHQTSSVLPSWCDLRPHRLSFFSKQRHQWVENILPEWPTVEWINRLNHQWINQIKPAKESIELSVSWLIKTRQCCSCHLNMLHL